MGKKFVHVEIVSTSKIYKLRTDDIRKAHSFDMRKTPKIPKYDEEDDDL